jgi:small subunit ribosomal protein S15
MDVPIHMKGITNPGPGDEGLNSALCLPIVVTLKYCQDSQMTALKRRPVVVGREMSITKEKKSELIGSFKRGEHDTGSPEVQIALLTARINDLTDHFKTHAKDHASRRGLLMMVSKRSGLLKYLRLHDRKKYLEVISRLGIRK